MRKNDARKIDFRIVIAIYSALVFALAFAGVFVYAVDNTESNNHPNIEQSYYPMPTYDLVMKPVESIEQPIKSEVISETAAQSVENIEEEQIVYYDIPLDESIQDHIFKESKRYGIDPALVVAIIDKESDFRPYVIGDNGRSYGLMQIQARWHQDRIESLGCTDLLDPYQNITVGLDYLAELSKSGKSIEWVLMAYNGGRSYANSNESKNIVTQYVNDVLNTIEQLNKE